MKITRKVKTILDNYGSDSPGVKGNLARMLMQGRLGGTGKMVILPSTRGSSMARHEALPSTRTPMTRTITSSLPSTPACRPTPRRWE